MSSRSKIMRRMAAVFAALMVSTMTVGAAIGPAAVTATTALTA